MRKDYSKEKKIAENIFKSKLNNRKKLAALPIEQKIEILIEMQKRAVEIAKSAGRDTSRMHVWSLN